MDAQLTEIRRLRRLVREYGQALDVLIPAVDAALEQLRHNGFEGDRVAIDLAQAVQQAKEAGE